MCEAGEGSVLLAAQCLGCETRTAAGGGELVEASSTLLGHSLTHCSLQPPEIFLKLPLCFVSSLDIVLYGLPPLDSFIFILVRIQED